jgi:tetratricopeptide (TPR) repeat protein
MGMESKNGREIHGQAEHEREGGNFLQSLNLLNEAIIAYAQDKDYLGMSEAQGSVFLALRHLYEQTNEKQYLILAKHAALAGVEIAETSGDITALALPYNRLGSAYVEMGDYKQAVDAFEKALVNMENNPPETHNRPVVLADIKVHLHHAEYKNGDKSALERMFSAIDDIKNGEEVKYNKDVWLSGAHMKVAEMLRGDDPQLAKEHLSKAKDIIDSNPDLGLRLGQWERLAEKF